MTQLADRIAQFKKMATDDPENELGHFRLGQLLSAIRAIRPSGLDGLFTFRARWLQQSAAVRTEAALEIPDGFAVAADLIGDAFAVFGPIENIHAAASFTI